MRRLSKKQLPKKQTLHNFKNTNLKRNQRYSHAWQLMIKIRRCLYRGRLRYGTARPTKKTDDMCVLSDLVGSKSILKILGLKWLGGIQVYLKDDFWVVSELVGSKSILNMTWWESKSTWLGGVPILTMTWWGPNRSYFQHDLEGVMALASPGGGYFSMTWWGPSQTYLNMTWWGCEILS